MKYYVAANVSLKETSIGVVDETRAAALIHGSAAAACFASPPEVLRRERIW